MAWVPTAFPQPPDDFLPGCLEWIREHLDWFSPQTWNKHLPARDIETQAILELLLLTRVLARGPRAGQTEGLRGAARDLALDLLSSPEVVDQLGRADAGFPYLAWPVGLLGPTDRLRAQRAMIRQVFERHGSGLISLDWPVVNQIELAYIAAVGGFASELPGFAELRGDDAYAARDPMLITESETYAVTHEILYATDLGVESLPVSQEAATRIGALVRRLLGVAVADGHLDLTAELMHCAVATPTGPGTTEAVATEAWPALAAGQLTSGALPGPPYDPQEAAGREGDRATAYTFATCYHTTVVAAMAAAAAEAQVPARGRGRPEPA